MFAQLGQIVFEVLGSPQRLPIKRAWRYAEHSLVETLPKLQFTGMECDQITLDLSLHALIADPATQRAAIYAAADARQVLPLVFGNGVHRGYFVITEAEEDAEQMTDAGDVLAIQMRVTLKQYQLGASVDPSAPPQPAVPPIGIVPAPSPGSTALVPATPNVGASALVGAPYAPGALTPTVNPDSFPPTQIVRSAS